MGDDFPIGDALIGALRDRLAGEPVDDVDDEARARAMAMVAIQVGYAVYGRVLRKGAGVTAADRPAVERQLAMIYERLALLDADGHAERIVDISQVGSSMPGASHDPTVTNRTEMGTQ
jgi:hypothetical protein